MQGEMDLNTDKASQKSGNKHARREWFRDQALGLFIQTN